MALPDITDLLETRENQNAPAAANAGNNFFLGEERKNNSPQSF